MLFALRFKAKYPGAEVTVYEASDRLLKRVLVSGNGRANFFNLNLLSATASRFFDDPEKAAAVIDPDTAGKTLDFIDIPYISDSENRCYPFSNSSWTLWHSLLTRLESAGIRHFENRRAKAVDPERKSITFVSGESVSYDLLFLATGGYSYDRSLAGNSELLKSVGLPTVETAPALCPLKVKERIPAALVGTRVRGQVRLLRAGQVIYAEEGEVLFKKDGLSGIAVFDASLYSDDGAKEEISLDLTAYKGCPVPRSVTSPYLFLPQSVAEYLQERFGREARDKASDLHFTLAGHCPYKDSQVTKGGVSLEAIDPTTLKVRRYPDIMLGGEVLDMAAVCGGYNMGFAFISGLKAADHC